MKTSKLGKYDINHIFHMSHIDNVESILKNGLFAHDNKFKKVDISDCDVNSRRSRIEPVYKKPIHSYVPFYFNPKNYKYVVSYKTWGCSHPVCLWSQLPLIKNQIKEF